MNFKIQILTLKLIFAEIPSSDYVEPTTTPIHFLLHFSTFFARFTRKWLIQSCLRTRTCIRQFRCSRSRSWGFERLQLVRPGRRRRRVQTQRGISFWILWIDFWSVPSLRDLRVLWYNATAVRCFYSRIVKKFFRSPSICRSQYQSAEFISNTWWQSAIHPHEMIINLGGRFLSFSQVLWLCSNVIMPYIRVAALSPASVISRRDCHLACERRQPWPQVSFSFFV